MAGGRDGFVYALNADTGRVEWRTKLGAPVSTDVAATATGLYAGTGDGVMHRLDAARGSVVASLTTPVLYFVQPPIAPMLLASWIELQPTIAFGPDGRLLDTAFPDALSPQGQLGAPIAALNGALGLEGELLEAARKAVLRAALDTILDR